MVGPEHPLVGPECSELGTEYPGYCQEVATECPEVGP